jgi:hypothetical protein
MHITKNRFAYDLSSGRAAPPYQAGVERVAIYVRNGIPKHMARQIDAKTWTSKMGRNIDLEHTLHALEGGPSYGHVQKILRRPPTSQATQDARTAP